MVVSTGMQNFGQHFALCMRIPNNFTADNIFVNNHQCGKFWKEISSIKMLKTTCIDTDWRDFVFQSLKMCQKLGFLLFTMWLLLIHICSKQSDFYLWHKCLLNIPMHVKYPYAMLYRRHHMKLDSVVHLL